MEKKAFLEQDTVHVAEQLIGCCLVRQTKKRDDQGADNGNGGLQRQ